MNELIKWRWIATGIVLLFVSVLVFVVLPYASFVYEKHALQQSQLTRIELATNSDERLNKLAENKKELNALVNQISVGLPENNELREVIDLVYKEAKRLDIRIDKMEPLEDGDIDTYVAKAFLVHISGTYHNVGKFVNAIEQGAFLIRMKEVALEKASDGLTGQITIEPILLKG